MSGVSVVIPAYNESTGIIEVINQVSKALQNFEHEIIVVDDGSTDDTAQLAQRTGLAEVISHTQNQGYGCALKTGIHRAKYDKIMIIDADATYPENAIPLLIEQSKTTPMVVGARTLEPMGEPVIRRSVKNLIVMLANWLADTNIPDLNSGFRIFDKNIALKYSHLLPSGFSFTSTITLVFLSEGYGVDYLPIQYRKRKGWSKFRPFKDTLNMLILILRTLVYFNPLRVFVPLSAALVLLALLVLFVSVAVEGRAWDITITAILVCAIQLFGIGLIADLLVKRLKR